MFTESDELILNYWKYWTSTSYEGFLDRVERSKWISEKCISTINGQYLIIGSLETPYTVTLTSCSCPDFQKRKDENYNYPCKHMCRIAIKNGILHETLHTQEEIDEKEREEKEYQNKLSVYKLPNDQLTSLLARIIDPPMIALDLHKNHDYLYSDQFSNKIDKYSDKVDDLLDKIREQYSIPKIIKLIDKIQILLVDMKKLFYEYGADGVSEYESLYDDIFENTKSDLQDILIYDFPENQLTYQEELELSRLTKKHKKAILKLISIGDIPQSVVINQLFPEQKSYGHKLCKELVDAGKIFKTKKGNKYILSLSKAE